MTTKSKKTTEPKVTKAIEPAKVGDIKVADAKVDKSPVVASLDRDTVTKQYKSEFLLKDPDFQGTYKLKCPHCVAQLYLLPYHTDIGQAEGKGPCPSCSKEITTIFSDKNLVASKTDKKDE